VKLLLDENLSRRVAALVADVFPGSQHVSEVGLASSDDAVVWDYARAHSFAIVSKDSDFHQRSFVFGAPPKVIWLRLGNCTTQEVHDLLRARVDDIEAFDRDLAATFLVVSR
jgi:predicted nuclease of predicted toxin-antitoxin system